MNHLLRGHAPISDDGWELIDAEARERLDRRARGPAAGRLRRPARLGALGDQPRPGRGGRRRRATGCRPSAAGCCRWSSCGRRSPSRSRNCAPATAGPRTSTSTTSTSPPARLASAENAAVFAGWARPGSRGSRASARTRRSPAATKSIATRAGWQPRSSCCCATGSAAPTGWRSSGDDYTHVVETAEHGGYPLFQHLREILEGPLVWTPGIEGAVVVSLRGGDFLFESGQDVAVGYDVARRGRRPPLPRGVVQLPGRDPGGRGRDPLSRRRCPRRRKSWPSRPTAAPGRASPSSGRRPSRARSTRSCWRSASSRRRRRPRAPTTEADAVNGASRRGRAASTGACARRSRARCPPRGSAPARWSSPARTSRR